MAREELALEGGARDGSGVRGDVGERIGERGDDLGGVLERLGAGAEREEVERPVADDTRRVFGEDGFEPDLLEDRVGRRDPEAAREARIGGREPVGRLAFDGGEGFEPFALARHGLRSRRGGRSERRLRRDARGGGGRDRERDAERGRRPDAAGAAGSRAPHSPITLTIRRLSRCPSNSA